MKYYYQSRGILKDGEFLHVRRWEKKNEILLSNAFNVYNLRALEHFGIEGYRWRLDIIQNVLLYFLGNFVQKYASENI